MSIKYYYLLGKKEYFLKTEPIEEILRERSHYYLTNNKVIDFWILSNLEKLKKIKLFNIDNLENYFCIVSTNKKFIDWLNLRFINFKKQETNILIDQNPFK